MHTTSNPKPQFTAQELRSKVLSTIESYKAQLEYWQKILAIAPQFEGQKIGKRLCDKFHALMGENVTLSEGVVMWEIRITDSRLTYGQTRFDAGYPIGKHAALARPEHGMWLLSSLLRHNEGRIANTAKDIPLLEAKLTEIDALVVEHDAILASVCTFNAKLSDLSAYAALRIDVENRTL